jgi:hypothetical protein
MSTGTIILGQKYTDGAAHVHPFPGPDVEAKNYLVTNIDGNVVTINFDAGVTVEYLTVACMHNSATVAPETSTAYGLLEIDVAVAGSVIGDNIAPPSSLVASKQLILLIPGQYTSIPLSTDLTGGDSNAGRLSFRCSQVAGDTLDFWIGAN